MGKTYRKEKPASKRRDEERWGDKDISHSHDRTQRKRTLKNIEHHWDDPDAFDNDDH